MAKKERKKITERRAKVANALAMSEGASADKNALAVLDYRAGSVTADIASPEMARAVKARLVNRLITEAAPLATSLLVKVVKAGHRALEKGEYSTALQVDAAKSLMQYAGLQAASEDLRLHKEAGEMNGAELEEAVRRFADELRRRQAIEAEGTVSAPDGAPEGSQAAEDVDSLFS